MATIIQPVNIRIEARPKNPVIIKMNRVVVGGTGSAANKLTSIINKSSQTNTFTAVAGTKYSVTPSSASIDANLPTSNTTSDLIFIQKADTSTNIVNIRGTINGVALSTLPLRTHLQGKLLQGDGAGGWEVIAGDLSLTATDARYVNVGYIQAGSNVTVSGSGTVGYPLIISSTASGSGDMLKSTYDTNNDGVVDNSQALNGQAASYYLNRANHTGAQAQSTITNLSTDLAAKESTANKGTANGYAPLDATSKVPAANLPSYVDDVVEYANLASFPVTGETGKIYTALDTNKIYRWSGSVYIEISASPGSTDAVPEGSTNLYYTNARASAAAPVQSVAGRTGAVTLTKSDVGLANVDNTSDANKPVSTAQATADNLRVLKAGDTMTNTLNIGLNGTTPASFVNDPVNASGSVNDTLQIQIQNQNSGSSASSDFVATANTGNDSTNYIDMGINSSAYSDASSTINGALDGYLYTNGGNLTVGTQTTAKIIKFHTGGTLAANERLQINDSGLKLPSGTANRYLTSDATGQLSLQQISLAAGVSGTLPIANGGSGQTTASAAFNAFSPMTTAGDIIYGGSAGAGTRLAAGTSTQILIGGTTPSWGSLNLATMVGSSILPVANGGTGSATQNWVDLTTAQTVGGAKTFSSGIIASGGISLPDYTSHTTSIGTYTTPYAGNSGHLKDVPFGDQWHDMLAFGNIATPTFETTTDNTTWTAGTFSTTQELFSLREATTVTMAAGAGWRWTWNSGSVSYPNINPWLRIAQGYSAATGPQHQVKVETSTDGTTWTQRHLSSNVNLQNQTSYYRAQVWGADTYLRISVYNSNTVATQFRGIRLLYNRPDTGTPIGRQLPFEWNYAKQVAFGNVITPGNGIVTIGNDSTTTASGGLYFGTGAAIFRDGSASMATLGKWTATGGLKIGTSSTTGYVWTATDTVGNGSWQAASGGGITNNFNNDQVDQAGGGTTTYGTLVGLVNGTNAVFTVSNGSYPTGKLKVWKNGQLMTLGSTGDYTETTPGSGTFTFAVAPVVGDIVTAAYPLVTSSSSSIKIAAFTNTVIATNSNTTTEYSVVPTTGKGSTSIPANSPQAGTEYELKLGGTYQTPVSPGQVIVKVKLGSVTIAQVTVTASILATSSTIGTLSGFAKIRFVTVGSTGTATCYGQLTFAAATGSTTIQFNTAGSLGTDQTAYTVAANTTGALSVDVTATWSNAQAGQGTYITVAELERSN